MMDVVVGVTDLLRAVDHTFAETGLDLAPWPDPHAGRSPTDDEYSRVTNAAKWRIVVARADAWLRALGEANLARIERGATVSWVAPPGTRLSQTDRAVPHRCGALPLVIGRSAIGDIDAVGVTVGVGDPAVCVAWLPSCGCDACDSGSQNELDELDRIIFGVVSGTFRRLSAEDRVITQFDPNGWSASGAFGRGEVSAVLANPDGWHEICGLAWSDRGRS